MIDVTACGEHFATPAGRVILDVACTLPAGHSSNHEYRADTTHARWGLDWDDFPVAAGELGDGTESDEHRHQD